MTPLTKEQAEALAVRIDQLTQTEILDAAMAIVDGDEWGCEYCRNDGALSDSGECPRCGAEYPDEVQP